MGVKCPKCDSEIVPQGNDYVKLFELAKAWKVRLCCPDCDFSWTPGPGDQRVFAAAFEKVLEHQ